MCLAVVVVALRQTRRVQRRNSSDRSICGKPLRRWTRRYSSQRDEFYLAKQIRTVPVRSGLSGVTTLEFSRPPRPSDVLRAGTARASVVVPGFQPAERVSSAFRFVQERHSFLRSRVLCFCGGGAA